MHASAARHASGPVAACAIAAAYSLKQLQKLHADRVDRMAAQQQDAHMQELALRLAQQRRQMPSGSDRQLASSGEPMRIAGDALVRKLPQPKK